MPDASKQRQADQHRPSRILTLLSFMEPVARRYSTLVNVGIHSVLFALALMLAQLVKFDTGVPGAGGTNWLYHSYLPWLPVFIGLKLLIFGKMRLFRSGWRYASIRDITNILLASWVFVLIMFVAVNVFRYAPQWLANMTGRRIDIPGVNEIIAYFASYSQGVLVLDFLATVFLVCTARLGFRLYREELRPVAPEGARRVLIVGAGDAAEAIIREIHRMQVERYLVVGMVDDDRAKRNITIHGVPVLGTAEDIRRVCEENEIEEIIIAMPRVSQKELRRVIGLCGGTKLKFQSLPGVSDLIDGRVTVSQMRTVTSATFSAGRRSSSTAKPSLDSSAANACWLPAREGALARKCAARSPTTALPSSSLSNRPRRLCSTSKTNCWPATATCRWPP